VLAILLAKGGAPGGLRLYSAINNSGSPSPVALQNFIEQCTTIAGTDELQPADTEWIDLLAQHTQLLGRR